MEFNKFSKRVDNNELNQDISFIQGFSIILIIYVFNILLIFYIKN